MSTSSESFDLLDTWEFSRFRGDFAGSGMCTDSGKGDVGSGFCADNAFVPKFARVGVAASSMRSRGGCVGAVLGLGVKGESDGFDVAVVNDDTSSLMGSAANSGVLTGRKVAAIARWEPVSSKTVKQESSQIQDDRRGGQDRYVEAGQPGEAEGDRARGRGELKCGERRGGKGGEAVLEMVLDYAKD